MNENGKINIIVVLLLIILIASIILALQITGVIKPDQKPISNTDTNTNTEINDNENYEYENQKSYEEIIEKYTRMETMSNVIPIVVYIVVIGLNIGICMLYKKLDIPDIIVKFNFIWPILSAISAFSSGVLQSVLEIASFIFGVMGLWYYFKAVGMSGWWAILPIGASLLSIFAIFGIFLSIIILVGFVSFIIAYIISNIHLAKIFEKGTGFTIGLVLLPFIFQPILGFQRN